MDVPWKKTKLNKALKQEKMPVLTEVISNMLISHVPISSTNKKIDSVREYVNELCAGVFMDDKHLLSFQLFVCSRELWELCQSWRTIICPTHVLHISSVKKEEDVRCHLPCLQSTEKILTTATAIWTISWESFVSYLHPADGKYKMLYN